MMSKRKYITTSTGFVTMKTKPLYEQASFWLFVILNMALIVAVAWALKNL